MSGPIQPSAFSPQPSGGPSPGRLLEHFRATKRRIPLHPLEKAVLAAVAIHLCFLPWALGTMHPWSQITSLVLATIGLVLALIPRTYSGDHLPEIQIDKGSQVSGFRSPVSAFRLSAWPRLLRFPIFWIGLALLGYIALQASNPSWVWTRNATSWWLVRVNDIEWLPTSIDTPFDRFNIWRQFIIYASAWMTTCTIWIGFTRKRSLRMLILSLVVNGVLLAGVGIVQKFAGLDSYLTIMKWPEGNTAFASFIYRNHAGAYFCLLWGLAVALAIWSGAESEKAQRKSSPAPLLLLVAILFTAAVFLSLSRGASLLQCFAWLALAVWFWVYRLKNPTVGGSKIIPITLSVLFLCALGFVVRQIDFSSIEARVEWTRKYYNTKYDSIQMRVQAHAAADDMAADYWKRGVGAGGFRFLYPEYLKKYPDIYHGGQFFWEHAHSDWRELLIELGSAGSLLLLLGGGWWILSFQRLRFFWHPLIFPVVLGCGQTLAHAWFDFPYQNPAILCTWLALLALSTRWLELDTG